MTGYTLDYQPSEANDQPYPQQKELSSRSPSVEKDLTLPKVNDVVKFKNKDRDQGTEVSVISRGGKAKGKYGTWFNIENLGDGTQSCVDFQSISKWEKLENTKETVNLLNIIKDETGKLSITDAKKKELLNWQRFKVFDEVKYVRQPLMTTRWVLTEREIQPKPFIKAHLVVRVFLEK